MISVKELPMRYFTLFLITIFFLGCSSLRISDDLYHVVDCKEKVYSIKSATCLEKYELIDSLAPYKVIFIGDTHSSKKQHVYVSNLIRDLSKRGYRIHLANEWFTPRDNAILAEYASGAIDDKSFIKKIQWNQKRSFDFDLFSPIYHSVIDTNGELYGINLSKMEKNKISNANINAMSKKEFLFYKNLDFEVSAHQMLLSQFFNNCHKAKHGETNEQCIRRMYSVQVAWDTKMGKESAKLAKQVLKSEKDKLIVFVGAFHLSKGVGVNLRFARESKIPFVTMLSQHSDHNYVLHGEGDFIYIYEREQASRDIEHNLAIELNKINSHK
ncbi:MAG: ChaN family lipoprotein [Sulfurimonas sp.]|nr:ChaN family lipoprotein [Sulfurimonas sp.]